MDRSLRENTRSRIQDVALELFIEQGYEATSLREIAEKLGVTKAALYYHFKTKDDIIASLAERRVDDIVELIEWVRGRPKTADTRRELLLRYFDQLTRPDHKEIMRFLERNQTSLRNHPKILSMREHMLSLVRELYEPDDSPSTRVRKAMALFTMHAGMWLTQNDDLTEEERRKATLEVALDLLER